MNETAFYTYVDTTDPGLVAEVLATWFGVPFIDVRHRMSGVEIHLDDGDRSVYAHDDATGFLTEGTVRGTLQDGLAAVRRLRSLFLARGLTVEIECVSRDDDDSEVLQLL